MNIKVKDKYLNVTYGDSFKVVEYLGKYEHKSDNNRIKNFFKVECMYCNFANILSSSEISRNIRDNNGCRCKMVYKKSTNERKCSCCQEWKVLNSDNFYLILDNRKSLSKCISCTKKRKSELKSWRKYKKERLITDKLYSLKERIRCNIRLSLHRQGYRKKSNTATILGCDIEFFKNYIESKFTEGMTWDNIKLWHLDHIVPISMANTEDDVIKLCHYSNFQPLWAKDNIEKSNKINFDLLNKDLQEKYHHLF